MPTHITASARPHYYPCPFTLLPLPTRKRLLLGPLSGLLVLQLTKWKLAASEEEQNEEQYLAEQLKQLKEENEVRRTNK